MAFVRERQIVYCERVGEQKKDIELNVMTEGRMRYYGSRRQRIRRFETAPKQATLNDKRAWIYFERLIEMNFGKTDYHLSLTYDDLHLPESPEAAKADYDRFVSRAKKLYKRNGIKFEAVMVMSYSSGKDGRPVRLHMHVILRGGVSRGEIEQLWRAPDRAGRCRPGDEASRYGEPLGYANCDRLQPDANGLAALCEYLKRQPRDGIARRYYATVGLRKPIVCGIRDGRYDLPELHRIARHNADYPDVLWWERRYPGWTLRGDPGYAYICRESDFSGLSIRVKLRRLTEKELRERKRERNTHKKAKDAR